VVSAMVPIRHTLRKLARSPGFTALSVLTVAVAIGANTAIFSVLNGVLLEPLPYEDPERLVGIWHEAPGIGFDNLNQSAGLHLAYRDHNRVFEDVGMWDSTRVSVTGRAEPEQVLAVLVTDGVFPLLRLSPSIGRTFTAEDDAPRSPETAVLGHGYWARRFGGDPNVLGQTLRIDGRPREIIGVMPPHVRFLGRDPAVYLPFRLDRAKVFVVNFSAQGLARLLPGVTLAQANADVGRMIDIACEEYPMPPGLSIEMLEESRLGPNLHPLKRDVVGDVGRVLWVLFGTVGLVLLIACANVTNLFLVRAESGQREVAVRTALGATWRRIAMHHVGESVVLFGLGGILGLGLAQVGIGLLLDLAPAHLPRLDEIALGPKVMLFTLAISVLAGLVSGTFPVLHCSSTRLLSALKDGGRGSSDGRRRHRVRTLLAASQVALAVVLLIGSGLMIRSYQALRRVSPGFVRPAEVLTVRVSIPGAEIEDAAAAGRAHLSIIEGLGRIPGVTSVGASSAIPMDSNDSSNPLFVESAPVPEGQLPPIRRFKNVAGAYFSTIGNPVIAGRPITSADSSSRARVAVITEDLAREYWATPREALGERVRETPESPWREIVGVVGSVRDDGVDQGPTPTVYWPMIVADFWGEELQVRRSMSYVIRASRRSPESLLPEVRQAIWSVNRNLPLASVGTLRDLLDRSMARTSFTLVLLGIAASVAMLLGMVGTYAVISYAVSQRTREIGVRVALGARRPDVVRMVLRHGGLVATIGVAVGLGAAVGLTRLMSCWAHTADVVPATWSGRRRPAHLRGRRRRRGRRIASRELPPRASSRKSRPRRGAALGVRGGGGPAALPSESGWA